MRLDLPVDAVGPSPGCTGGILRPGAVVSTCLGAPYEAFKGRPCEFLQKLRGNILTRDSIPYRTATDNPCRPLPNIWWVFDISRGGGGGTPVEVAQGQRTHTPLGQTYQGVFKGGLPIQGNAPPPTTNPDFYDKLVTLVQYMRKHRTLPTYPSWIILVLISKVNADTQGVGLI